jgi:RNA polymerase-binding transcription factor DksA
MAKPAQKTSKTAAAPAKAASSKTVAPATKKTAPAATKAAAPAKKAAASPKASPKTTAVSKKAAPPKVAPKATATKKAAPVPATKKATPSTASAAPTTPAPKSAAPKSVAKAVTKVEAVEAPAAAAPKKVTPVRKAIVPLEKGPAKPIMKAGGDFDAKFLTSQTELLLEERASLVGQADRMESEAASLMEDLDPGDVQFDDESGEGDSLVVERERDLALSAQARQMVADIDAALIRIKNKTYGYSLQSGRPIPRERLKAIPWATELVEEKVGGLGSR